MTVAQPIVTVPANGVAKAVFHLQMPAEPFEGDILGGFLFAKVPDENEVESEDRVNEEAAGGIMIKNVYIYCVAVHLTESAEKVAPDFAITAASMGTLAGFPALVLDIQNLAPAIVSGAELEVTVHPQDEEASVFSFVSAISMAPKTAAQLSKLWTDVSPFTAGDYRLKASIHYENNTWAFEIPLRVE